MTLPTPPALPDEAWEMVVRRLRDQMKRRRDLDSTEIEVDMDQAEQIISLIEHLAPRWKQEPDIPNIEAMNVFHRDIGKPLVTRRPDGVWFTHPPLSLLPPQKGST